MNLSREKIFSTFQEFCVRWFAVGQACFSKTCQDIANKCTQQWENACDEKYFSKTFTS
jgi:hypothetical protein